MTTPPPDPDFARLYGDVDGTLSPRMAFRLWTAALFLGDSYRDPDEWDLLIDKLPPIVHRLADEVWIRRFVDCFCTVADRLGRGRADDTRLTSCTGEEMALHLVIDCAEGLAKGEVQVMDESLPEEPARDADFEWAREVLFRDHDVLLLFNMSLDGIEETESEVSRYYRFPNLHPQRWFLPFADQLDDE